MNIFSVMRNSILTIAFVSSISLNVAIVASSTVATAMSGMYEAVTGLKSHISAHDKKMNVARQTVRKIKKRTIAMAVRNAGSIAAEAIPYVGIAVVLGVTAMDLNDACETMKDMQELDNALNPNDDIDSDVDMVCGMNLPDFSDWLSLPDIMPQTSPMLDFCFRRNDV